MQQQIRRAAVSREKREAAMAVFGRLWQEEPAPLRSTNSVTTYGHTALAVSLAHSGDGAGADAVIEALTDGADRLYPVSYNTTAAYTAFAEIYLLSHSVLPDGTGLADFEERIAAQDRGMAVYHPGCMLHEREDEDTALVVYARAMDVLEEDADIRRNVEAQIEAIRSKGRK